MAIFSSFSSDSPIKLPDIPSERPTSPFSNMNFFEKLGALGQHINTGGESTRLAMEKFKTDQQRQELGNILSGQSIPAFYSQENTPSQVEQLRMRQLGSLGTPEALNQIPIVQNQMRNQQLAAIIADPSIPQDQKLQALGQLGTPEAINAMQQYITTPEEAIDQQYRLLQIDKIKADMAQEAERQRVQQQILQQLFGGGLAGETPAVSPSNMSTEPGLGGIPQQTPTMTMGGSGSMSPQGLNPQTLQNAYLGAVATGNTGLATGIKGIYDMQTGNKPPTGYNWGPNGNLVPIPGGPAAQVSAEQAGRVALAKTFLDDAPIIRQKIAGGALSGPVNKLKAEGLVGEQGQTVRQIKSGVDALRRGLTGAGMPASEAEDYVKRYEPQATDTTPTLLSKFDQLTKELSSYTSIAAPAQSNTPSIAGARQAPDGKLYVPDPARPGKYLQVVQ